MDQDPWHWDVGDVVAFFRQGAAGTLPENQRSRLPSSDDFFDLLQDEGVTGECLLTAIDVASLRDEYGIKSAMTRTALWSCICKLRVRSLGYAAQHGLPTFQTQTPRSLPPTALPETPIPQPLDPTAVIASVEEVATGTRVGESTRSGEYQVQDASGRKRRKLDLSQPETGAKRHTSAKVSKPYLPASSVSVDEMFYGSTAIGEEIGELVPNGTITVLDDDRDEGLQDNDFQLQRHDKPDGEVCFVYKNMRKMFRHAQAYTMRRQNRDALVLHPYKASHSEIRSATVIQFINEHDEEPVAFKESTAHLDSTVPEKHAEAGGEWGFLVEKYAAEEDRVLPQYGDSETAMSDSKHTADESDSESMAEESVAPDELSNEEASDIIDEVIREQTALFDNRLEKLEQKKAYTEWSKMKRSRTIREELIQSAQLQLRHLHSRLQKQKEHLLQSQWKSAASLKNVCNSLQVTVEDIEYQRWRIGIWNRKKEPWHAKRAKRGTISGDHASQDKHHAATSSRLIIPENDRFSVSPPPEDLHDTNSTLVDGDGPPPNQDNIYEGDDEAFHTPEGSPALGHASPGGVAGADEQDDGGFIVDDDDIPEADLEDEQLEGGNAGRPALQSPPSGKNSPYEPLAGSDIGSDELPSPSNFKMNKLKREPLPSTPASKRIMSIDLTGDSPLSTAPTPGSRKREKPSSRPSITDDPNNADAQVIDSWEMADLVRMGDRKRVLLKILRNTDASQRTELHKCLLTLQRAAFTKHLQDKLVEMQNERIEFFNDDKGDILRLAAGIYLRWYYPFLLTTASPADIPWDSALEYAQINAFSAMLDMELRKKDTPRFNSPRERSAAAPGSSSANAMILSSDNEISALSQQTPRKKRKRAVAQSQAALGNRQKAFERMLRAEQAESQSGANSSQLAAMIDTDPSNSSVQINFPKLDDEPEICVARKIAIKMKEHQINGARFLWREITATDEDVGHGCVLAHTMGLGKTMQTISLLEALNEAAHSGEKAVRSQLPRHLRPKEMRTAKRHLRVIILCPAGLIQNWDREIKAWASKRLGHVFCLDSSVKAAARPDLISDWMRVGGVLLLGYEMFRNLVNPSSDKRVKHAPFNEEQTDELIKSLLDGPQIVVADEAHNLKNEKSAIGSAVKRFKTESRIALTGTPMSNDVQEIYALVSWVSPDYLGDPTEFKATFAEPIKEGLYVESTRAEQRKSIKKLQVLHREIKPKVHRANIEALRGSIPGKVEFVIFVSLQELQIELYRRYIRAVKAFLDTDRREDGSQKTSQVVFMSMLSVLTLLTGHPRCFRDKLLEPPKEKKSNQGKEGEGDGMETESDTGGRTPSTASGAATPLITDITTAQELLDKDADRAVETHVSAQGLTPESVLQILGGDDNDIGSQPALSSKITIFLQLLRSCLAAKDQVIVFSQRLGMLDYLGQVLEAQDIDFGRIDGTNMSKRMPMLEQFNSGDFSVMLVSTKAGGVGLNMQCANRVFIFDSGFNPTYEEQAIGRAYRLGQKKPVYVYRFVAAGTFETNIYNKQLLKTSLASRVVDKKNPRRTAERNTREYLYEPKDPIQQDITEHVGKDPQVLGKLLSRHGSGNGGFDTMIRDVKTMETLTEEIMDEPLDEQEKKEVEEETEARKQRPRGRQAFAAAATGAMMPGVAPLMSGAAPLSTMPAPGFMPPMPSPPSTYAGSSRGPMPHGLPNV